RSVKGVKKQIKVHVFAQFAPGNSAAKRGIGFLPARLHESFTESCNEVPVALASGKNCGNDSSTPAAKNLYQLTHLLAHIRVDRASVRKMQRARRATCERICDKSSLVG